MMGDSFMDVVYHLICQGPSIGRSERTGALRKSNKQAARTREAILDDKLAARVEQVTA
jgi:hypothetical protein